MMDFDLSVKQIEERVYRAAQEFVNIGKREGSNAFHDVAATELVRLGQKTNALHRASESNRKEAVDELVDFSWHVHTAAIILERSMSSMANRSQAINAITKDLLNLRRGL